MAEEKKKKSKVEAEVNGSEVSKNEVVAEANTKTEAKKTKNSIEAIEKEMLLTQNNDAKFPKFNVGDTVKVFVKIVEGEKQRLQPYEGLVLGFRHGSNRKSFIVRRISYGVAIERLFPFHSPYVEKIEVIRKGRVRRAKLYYMRGRFGRSAVVAEKV